MSDISLWRQRHVCQPEEVAAVARFLVSESGSYVTGQRIYVDGGATITPE